MTCEVQSRGAIELYFYGELSAMERAGIQAHLLTCTECRQALRDLQMIRAALASRPEVNAPAGGDWSGFMARLEAGIESTAPGHGRSQPAIPAAHRPIRRIAPYLAIAALLALVTIGVVLIGRARIPTTSDARVAAPPPAAPAAAGVPANVPAATRTPDAALASLSGQHFGRSKLVLLGITTRDAGRVQDKDWAYERDRAAALLGETRLYRQAAEQRGMEGLAGVMRDLELVLLQTSMSEAPEPASVEQLQRLIRRRDLLTKMDVYETGS
jgi:hypothetical protein